MISLKKNLLWLKKKARKVKGIVNHFSHVKQSPLAPEDVIPSKKSLSLSTTETAVQRIDRAQAIISKDIILGPNDDPNQVITWKSDQGHQVIVNRSVSETLLQTYEEVGSSAARLTMHPGSSASSWKLEKPDKNDILLKFALTNVNGEVWERQRPLIQKAFSVSDVRQHATSAARKSLHEYLRQQTNSQIKRKQYYWESPSHTTATMVVSPSPIRIDARHMSWYLALDTMAVAVVSSQYASLLRGHLEPLYGPTLVTNRNQPQERQIVKQVVTSIVQNMIMAKRRKETSNQPCCLAESLLEYYKEDSNVYNASSNDLSD
jgi:hypothetical protein